MANSKISALTSATTPLAGTETLPIVQSSTTKQVSVANLTAGRSVATGALTSTSTTEGAAIGAIGNAVTSLRSTNDSQIYMGYRSTPNAFVIGATYASTGAYLPIIWATSDTARWQLETDGSITQKTAAKGINFTANTPAAGMTSQLLNWYEEGTWTPTQGAGLVVVGTFTSSGRYTRVGRLVTVTATLGGSTSIACTAGGAFTTGLPYTPSGGNSSGSAANSNALGTVLLVGSTSYSASAMAAAAFIYMSATYSV